MTAGTIYAMAAAAAAADTEPRRFYLLGGQLLDGWLLAEIREEGVKASVFYTTDHRFVIKIETREDSLIISEADPDAALDKARACLEPPVWNYLMALLETAAMWH
jgi:hypothetical protein